MESKKLRHILVVVWGIIFCLNFVITLWSPSSLGWAIVGFSLGGVFIMLLDNPIMSLQDDFIKSTMRINKIYSENYRKLLEDSKELKGGRKKRK